MVLEAIYILHFDKPLEGGNERYGDEYHYIGTTENWPKRIRKHLNGTGAKVVGRAIESGNVPTWYTTIPGVYSVGLESTLTEIGARKVCSRCLMLDNAPVQDSHPEAVMFMC